MKSAFSYCFKSYNKEYPATIKLNKIKKRFLLKDGNKSFKINSISVPHGKVNSICYIINNKLAYVSDVSEIKKDYYKLFSNLKFLIIDCLWYRYHPSHLNLEKILDLIKVIRPKKTILTNLHSDLDYNELNKKTPKNVVPAYDGLTINL